MYVLCVLDVWVFCVWSCVWHVYVLFLCVLYFYGIRVVCVWSICDVYIACVVCVMCVCI